MNNNIEKIFFLILHSLGAQTWYTVLDFSLYQPLPGDRGRRNFENFLFLFFFFFFFLETYWDTTIKIDKNNLKKNSLEVCPP